MMTEGVERPVARKRGRPPLLDKDRDHSNNSDLHANSSDSWLNEQTPRRKRGRPRKDDDAPPSSKPIRSSSVKSDMSTDRYSDSHEYFDSTYKSYGSIRRSRRYKPPDPNKEMLILLPNDDPIIKLSVPDTELSDLMTCLDDPVELESDMDDDEPSFNDSGENVFVPKVTEIKDYLYDIRSSDQDRTSSNKIVRNKIKETQNVSSNQWFDYSTYDADSDDESFIKKLSTPITISELSIIISVLEREFELSRNLSPLIADSAMAQQKCETLVGETEKLLDQLDEYLDRNYGDNEDDDGYDGNEREKMTDNINSNELDSLLTKYISNHPTISPRNNDLNNNISTSFGISQTYFSDIRIPKHRTFTSQQIYDFLSLTNTMETLPRLLEPLVFDQQLLDVIIKYYIDKRSHSKCSLLRCYHDFIMDNWSRDKLNHSSAPIDKIADKNIITNQILQLVNLRKDLDKARLIIDRVRRREKLKRDLIRQCIEHSNVMDLSYTLDLGNDNDQINDTQSDSDEYISELSYCEPIIKPVPIQHQIQSKSSNLRVITEPITNNLQNGVSNWTQDEDIMLLLGVAACGLGRWTEIREDFALTYRNSAQMNQRFFRLTKRRISRLSSSSSSSTTTLSVFDSSSPPWLLRNTLTSLQKLMLETFDEELTWNRIALRFLFDNHQQEIRSGRPVKHPVQIPIPKEYKMKAFLKYKHLLARRPSSPSFKPPMRSLMYDEDIKAKDENEHENSE